MILGKIVNMERMDLVRGREKPRATYNFSLYVALITDSQILFEAFSGVSCFPAWR